MDKVEFRRGIVIPRRALAQDARNVWQMGLGGEWCDLWVLPSSPALGDRVIRSDWFDLCPLCETLSQYLVLDHFAFRAERILAVADPGTHSRPGLSVCQGTNMSHSISL